MTSNIISMFKHFMFIVRSEFITIELFIKYHLLEKKTRTTGIGDKKGFINGLIY